MNLKEISQEEQEKNINRYFSDVRESMSRLDYISFLEIMYIGFRSYMRNITDLRIAMRCYNERGRILEEMKHEND